jgi:hypothetical protein
MQNYGYKYNVELLVCVKLIRSKILENENGILKKSALLFGENM